MSSVDVGGMMVAFGTVGQFPFVSLGLVIIGVLASALGNDEREYAHCSELKSSYY